MTATAGKIGGGANSTSTGDYTCYGSGASLANFTTLTYEFWIDISGTNFNFPAGKQDPSYNDVNDIRFNSQILNYRRYWSGSNGLWTGSTVFSANRWYSVVVAYDGSSTSNSAHIYVNGVPETMTTSHVPAGTLTAEAANPMCLANRQAGGGPTGTTGTFDEFRYSNIVRSAGWAATEYNNESAPASFYMLGSTVTM
jgi:hypothetical protein